MHTNPRHRLSIAVPLFCLMVTAGFADTWRTSASIASFADGVVLRAEAGTHIDRSGMVPHFEEGAVTISSKALWVIGAGTYRLLGWNGAAQISLREDGALLVVALTTPVLIEQHGRSALVPIGMQLTLPQNVLQRDDESWDAWYGVRTPLPVPATFLLEHLPLALRLMEQSMSRANPDLPKFLEHEERLMLARFHPLLKNKAWLLSGNDRTLTHDHERLLIVLSPLADQATGEALLPSALRIWGSLVERRTDIPAVLPLLLQSVQSLANAGYPERTARYAAAILPLCDEHAKQAVTSCDALRSLIKEPMQIMLPPVLAASSVSSSTAVSLLDAAALQQLEEKAIALIAAAGFMSTPHTTFTAEQDGFVRIDNLVLGTATGDRLFSIRFDPVHDRIVTFGTDGKPAPFALTLQAYVQWVKGE